MSKHLIKNEFDKKRILPKIIFCLLFAFIGLPLTYLSFDSFMYNHQMKVGLKAYQPMIEYIGKYKLNNGKYPQSVSEIKIKSEIYPYYSYETFNNQKDFVLEVRPYKSYSLRYRYCTDTKLKDCDASIQKWPDKHLQVGDWVAIEFLD